MIAMATMTMLVSAVVDAAGNPYIIKKKILSRVSSDKLASGGAKRTSKRGQLLVKF
jgi:hypothetical protein